MQMVLTLQQVHVYRNLGNSRVKFFPCGKFLGWNIFTGCGNSRWLNTQTIYYGTCIWQDMMWFGEIYLKSDKENATIILYYSACLHWQGKKHWVLFVPSHTRQSWYIHSDEKMLFFQNENTFIKNFSLSCFLRSRISSTNGNSIWKRTTAVNVCCNICISCKGFNRWRQL